MIKSTIKRTGVRSSYKKYGVKNIIVPSDSDDSFVAFAEMLSFKQRVLQDGGNFEYEQELIDRIELLQSLGLYDRFSVVLTPTAFKQGKIYALKGPDFTFSRSTSITRKAPNDLIESVPYNKLLQSNYFDFSSQWIRAGVGTVADVAIAPDGTLTADSMTEANNAAAHYLTQTISKPTIRLNYIYSFYAKSGIRDYVRARVGDSTFTNICSVAVNLMTGQVFPELNIGVNFDINSTVVSQAENGFWKITVDVTTDASASALFVIGANADSDVSSYTPPINNAIALYLWRAQVVLKVNDKPYQDVGTIANFPTIGKESVYNEPSIIIEPQRTNLLIQSANFPSASWGKSALQSTTNIEVSPEGILNGAFIEENATTNFHQVNQLVTKAASALQYSFRIFLKSGNGRTWARVVIYDGGSNGVIRWVNLSGNGALGTLSVVGAFVHTSSSIILRENGWYEVILIGTSNTVTTIGVSVGSAPSDGVSSFLGELTKGIYLWGAQLEQAPYNSSYIPTIASAVTRTTDVCSAINASDYIGQTEGTIHIEFSKKLLSITCVFNIAAGVVNSNDSVTIGTSGANLLQGYLYRSGAEQANIIFGAFTADTKYRCALVYKANYVAFFVNGVKVGQDLVASLPAAVLSTISFYVNPNNNHFNSDVRVMTVSKTALTDQECIDLTTP